MKIANNIDGMLFAAKRKTFIALAHGCFDYLHLGHIRYLQKCAALGPLFVTVTGDAFVNKGQDRPYYDQHQRAEMLAALECVDCVAINQAPDELDILRALRPRYYCKGSEYLGGNTLLQQAQSIISLYGGQLMFIDDELDPDGKKYSSTTIIERVKGAA